MDAISMKPRKLSAVLFLIYAVAAPAIADESAVVVYDMREKRLTPQVILESWPICDLPTSLGQICRAYWESKRPNGIEELLESGSAGFSDQSISFTISETVLQIFVESEWIYLFEIFNSPDGHYEVVFTDSSLEGSYDTRTTYFLTLHDGALTVRELRSN